MNKFLHGIRAIMKLESSSSSRPNMDLVSPYYLTNSDNSGTVLLSYLLTGENYLTWVHAMTNALHAKNKLCFVDGSLLKSEASSSDASMWAK